MTTRPSGFDDLDLDWCKNHDRPPLSPTTLALLPALEPRALSSEAYFDAAVDACSHLSSPGFCVLERLGQTTWIVWRLLVRTTERQLVKRGGETCCLIAGSGEDALGDDNGGARSDGNMSFLVPYSM